MAGSPGTRTLRSRSAKSASSGGEGEDTHSQSLTPWRAMSGRTTHGRPEKHRFSHDVSMDFFSLQSDSPRGWIRSFRRSDYFGEPDVPLDQAVREVVRQEHGVSPTGRVDMLTHLRSFGYCFNPISFYFCWREEERESQNQAPAVDFLVIEVTNIPWKQRTVFALDVRKGSRGSVVRPKSLHVSPFNPVPDGEHMWHISYDVSDLPRKFSCNIVTKLGKTVKTHASLNVQQNETVSLRWFLPQCFWMAILIHVHAFFLWLKGCTVFYNTTDLTRKRF